MQLMACPAARPARKGPKFVIYCSKERVRRCPQLTRHETCERNEQTGVNQNISLMQAQCDIHDITLSYYVRNVHLISTPLCLIGQYTHDIHRARRATPGLSGGTWIPIPPPRSDGNCSPRSLCSGRRDDSLDLYTSGPASDDSKRGEPSKKL